MTKNDDKCVPALRFKGFNNDWAQQELKDLVSFYSGLTYHPEDIKSTGVFVIRSSNIKHGQLVNADNVYVDPKSVNSTYVRKKDIIVVVRNGSRNLIGKHAQVHNDISKSVIGAFMTGIRSNNNDFISALFDSDKFRKEIHKNLGATINQITTGEFKKMIFLTPQTLNEKEKIGNLISQINSLVSLQQRKLQQLKLLKKAMLQDLFTDKKVPKLRFSGFKENWIQCKLGEIVKVIGGGTPSTKNPKYWNGQINWYSPNEIGSSIFVNSSKKKITSEGLKHSSAKLLPGNKTILFTSRAGIGDMAIMTSDGTTNQGFQSWIVDSKDTDIYFLYTLGFKLKRQSLRKASGSTFLEISNSEVKQLKLTVPSIEEQELIGLIVQKMDRLIVIQQKEFNKLESLKKFLLQNMFI